MNRPKLTFNWRNPWTADARAKWTLMREIVPVLLRGGEWESKDGYRVSEAVSGYIVHKGGRRIGIVPDCFVAAAVILVERESSQVRTT